MGRSFATFTLPAVADLARLDLEVHRVQLDRARVGGDLELERQLAPEARLGRVDVERQVVTFRLGAAWVGACGRRL